MSLVTPRDIAKSIYLDRFGKIGTGISWILMRLLGISKINHFYDKIKDREGVDFINAILDELNIEFEIPEDDLKRIPKEGAFITVSNHPLGGMDGVLLLKLMLEQRPDYKVLSSFILQRIEPLKPFLIPVNNFENKKNLPSSLSGIKEALKHLQEGKALGVFPAGEVSTYKEDKLVVDRTWDPVALKLMYKANVPIVPIYFHAKNSKIFYLLSKIHPVLRTATLPSEAISKRKRKIEVRIGKPISVKDQASFADFNLLGEFLRKKTYILAKTFEKKKDFHLPKLKNKKIEKEIIPPVPIEKLEKDIENLLEKNTLLFEKNDYQCFLSEAKEMPAVLREISRMREVTFRLVGEGTGKEYDLDKYDKYYKHLFLWDKKNKKLVGAYRMGMGQEIFERHGIKGFYLSELFTFEPELYDMMSKSIEMGRAFVVPEYQQKPFPLFLLWRGIMHTVLRHPEHEYLIGPVSISDRFSDFSKSLLIEFMKSNFYDAYTAQFVKPKKAFKVRLNDEDKKFIFQAAENNLSKFDKLIDELEPGALKVPILLKKYIKQNAKLISFNVDPNFNDAIDGLMYIKISDIPEETVKPVMEEFSKQFFEQKEKESK
jgi:putative hemolysin